MKNIFTSGEFGNYKRKSLEEARQPILVKDIMLK